MTDDPRFLICLPYILKEEGGNSDDPHDPGGRTSRGITQAEWDADCKLEGKATSDVYLASDSDIADVYFKSYWEPYCDLLSIGVDLWYFNICVNGGLHEATILLQRGLGVTADGHIGVVTKAALKDANPVKLIIAATDAEEAFYRSLKTFRYFGKGWIERSERIKAASLKMAVGAT